jgi:uncharacterized membrane protein
VRRRNRIAPVTRSSLFGTARPGALAVLRLAISSNCIAAAADKRADLGLQISLLAEHEITKLTTLVSAMAERLGVSTPGERELAEIQQDIAPEAVLEEIENKAPH